MKFYFVYLKVARYLHITMAARSFFAWHTTVEAQAQDERNHLRRIRIDSRRRFDAFQDLGNTEFTNQYRLSKESVLDLCQELDSLTGLRGTQQVTLQQKVLTALFYYASGSHQRPIGVAVDLSQKMCSEYIDEVTTALIHPNMLEKYIVFPPTPAARQTVSQRFYEKYGIPGVIGCIDGCHFKIFTPFMEVEHLFYCRKHYHSVNVQMVCDDETRIINMNAKFGGQSHDAFIWENSQLNMFMQDLNQKGERYWLLGDSGYPQRPWLMTPFLGGQSSSPQQEYYNKKQMVARVLIENTFGRLKNRWRCLSTDHVMHYKPDKCSKIIQACCVLYNIALQYKIPIPVVQGNSESTNSELPQPVHILREDTTSTDLQRGRAYRNQLVARLWAERF